jgi:hypothetical protein
MIKHDRSATPPEEALLLSVASQAASPVDPPDDARAGWCKRLIGGRFDWSRFLCLAERQRCGAAAHRYLSDLDLRGHIPPDVLKTLEDKRYLAQAHYMRKLADLQRLLEYFHGNGIAPLVLKGIPLAHRLYTDPAVRFSRDIDLLCREEDLERADRLLGAAGYSWLERPLSREDDRAHHFHFVYVRGEHKDTAVEIHWNLRAPVKGAPLDTAPLWERARAVEVGGTAVPTLGPMDAMWHMALGLCSGDLLDLRDLGDVRRFARLAPEGAWPDLALRCRESGTINEVSAALAVSERAFGSFLPPKARRLLRPDTSIRTLLLPAFTACGIAKRRMPFNDTHPLVVCWLLREGIRRKVSFLWRLAIPDRAALIETRGAAERPRRSAELLRFHTRGVWMLVKVLGAAALSPLIARTKWQETPASGTAFDHECSLTGIHHI